MLEYMEGKLKYKGVNYVVIEVGGIGYKLYVTAITLSKFNNINDVVMIFTYLHIREDELSLYGFFSNEEKEIFVTLLKVSGIGPKLALTILSQLNAEELRRTIILEDIKPLVNISGVGKKTAGRMILELKDKMGKDALPVENVVEMTSVNVDARGEAVSALLTLGYNLAEAQKAVPIMNDNNNVSVEELIRLALKNSAKY
ncbi:MAG: Holliday junction branch migration protein RuvA [Clostridia bacterium]|nr:Holliday junction branch migration protein RuvA [Clostridia bacterium]MDD4047216.1 Holliday junction branch migration protein RuvA [Clostridia bacterium]